MLKWILRIAQIAATLNMRRMAILFVVELLRQFDRSLTDSEIQHNPKRSGKSGFVYIIRDQANEERFKMGYRANPPWRDSQLRTELGKSGDLCSHHTGKRCERSGEKAAFQAYAKHSKKSEWFSLNESERREILIIAALIQLVAGNDLGMAAVDQEIVNVATVLLNKLQASAKALWKKRQSHRSRAR